jgi:uncharacterized repeat protein (TIGR01451 family)/fimbrial isopeptide formation D2 family protein
LRRFRPALEALENRLAPATFVAKDDFLVNDVDGDGVADPGDTLQYTISITNPNPQGDFVSAVFTDSPDANTALVAGTVTTSQGGVTTGNTPGDTSVAVDIGTISALASVTITFQVKINASLPADVVQVANQGQLAFSDVFALTDDPAATGADDPTVTPVPQADLTVTKTDSPDPIFADQDITYLVSIGNIGLSDAQNVVFSDALPANTTFVSGTSSQGTTVTFANGVMSADLGTLPSDGTVTLTLVLHVNAATSDGTTITNTATASSTTAEINPGDNASTTTTTVQAVDVAVTKSDSPDPVVAGTNLTYVISVVNNAVKTSATGVSLTDVLPAGTTFVSFSAPAGWFVQAPAPGGSGDVTAFAEILPAGDSAKFTLVVHVDANFPLNSDVGNTAMVSNAIVDSDLSNNTARASTAVAGQAELVVNKSGPAVAKVRSLLSYTVTVSNAGPSDAVNVVLADLLPASTILAFQSQVSGPAFTLSNSGNSIADAIARLPVGASASFVITAFAAKPGVMVNMASVSSNTPDPQPGDNAAIASTVVGNKRQRWIAQVYRDLLQREVRPGELAAWERFLQQPGSQRTLRLQISSAILNSLEYKAKVIEQIYAELLEEHPTIFECQHFLDFLIQGGTPEQLRANILGSAEYFEDRGGSTNAGWAAAVYRDVLHRPISGPELTAVLNALARGESRESIALGIINSTEARVLFVRDLYNRFLHREPTPAELRNRLAQLQAGVRDEDIIAAILASPEYFNNA